MTIYMSRSGEGPGSGNRPRGWAGGRSRTISGNRAGDGSGCSTGAAGAPKGSAGPCRGAVKRRRPYTAHSAGVEVKQLWAKIGREALLQRLRATSYFRLAGYAYPFLEGERYREGTTLEQVWRLYTFDHRLRTLFIDAIESIEVHVRTQLAYEFAHAHGPFAYMEDQHFPNFEEEEKDFKNWRDKLKWQVKRSTDPKGAETFAVNYFRDHGDAHELLPVWMMIELLFRNASRRARAWLSTSCCSIDASASSTVATS